MSKVRATSFTIRLIGYITNRKNEVFLRIHKPFRAGLKQLDCFSHVIVFWWADRHDNHKSRSTLQAEPPYAKGHLTGVFAMRSEYRPNPLAMTTCKILGCNGEEGVVKIAKIDAFDGTPIIDLKGYFPVCDRVKEVKIPEWLSFWPEWMPEDGIGLQQDSND